MEDVNESAEERGDVELSEAMRVDSTAQPAAEKTSAEILRERREAAMGGPNVDNEIHRGLPLARVAYALLALTVLGYAVSRLGTYLGNAELESIASIATALLFITTFIVWFVSRHQAKVLTEEKYADQRAAIRRSAEERAAREKAEKAAAKAARKRRRKK